MKTTIIILTFCVIIWSLLPTTIAQTGTRRSTAVLIVSDIEADINAVCEYIDKEEEQKAIGIIYSYLQLPPSDWRYCYFFRDIADWIGTTALLKGELSEQLYLMAENYDCHCH